MPFREYGWDAEPKHIRILQLGQFREPYILSTATLHPFLDSQVHL